MREPESTGFIADVPTVWDESIVLDGKMGEYKMCIRDSPRCFMTRTADNIL